MSRPDVGERVIFFVNEADSVFAVVVLVTYWDKIDIQLPDGKLLYNVRRVIVLDGERVAPISGRFMRAIDGY